MKTHTLTAVKTRLAERCARPGGVGVDEAVAAAESRLEGMREAVMAQIDVELAELRRLLAALAAGPPGVSASMSATCDRVTGLCGLPGLEPLAQAARSFCRLAELLDGPVPADAARVHVDTMSFLRAATPAQSQCAAPAMLQGLDAIISACADRRLQRGLTASSAAH